MTEQQVKEGINLCNEIQILRSDVIVLESFAGTLQKNSNTIIEFYSKGNGGAKMEALAPGLIKSIIEMVTHYKNEKIGTLERALKSL